MASTPAVLLDARGDPLRRPVVYLDQSTLSDAFDGTRGAGSDPATTVELATIVADIARRGTLCVSSVHMIELAQRPRFDEAHALARWLDGLEPMWFQMEGSAEAELEAEVGRRLGLEVPPSRILIHRAASAAMGPHMHTVSPEGTVDLLREPTIAGALRQVHGKLDEAGPKMYSLRLFRRFHDDRTNMPPETTREQLLGITNGKLYRQYEIETRAVINARPILIGEPRPTDIEVSAAVRALLDDPAALPLNKIATHIFREVGKRIAASDPESQSFKDRYASFLWDTRHALAAAVVDVFTCDRFVDMVMSDFRTSRGLPRQLSIRGCGGQAGFVAELRRQCA
jgi:hypothetical protein